MKNKSFISVPKLWKDSAIWGSTVIAIIGTFMGVAGFTIDNLVPNQTWLARLLIIIVLYILLSAVIGIALTLSIKKGFSINIRGIEVHIRQGDIFETDGWKVIPCNEYFDTTVDNIIISETTVNGIFIKNYVSDIKKLQETILSADENSTTFKRTKKGSRLVYPQGRIITYENYMLLSFAHFNNQNIAHISKPEYEKCLLNMWKEIRRTYANKPVFLPLIGSGITSFDDVPEKSNFDLIKCMVCTLKASGENFNQPINIVLTKKVIQELNLYELKGVI